MASSSRLNISLCVSFFPSFNGNEHSSEKFRDVKGGSSIQAPTFMLTYILLGVHKQLA